MRPHRVVVLDVLTRHPPQMPFVDGDDVIEALAPERPDHPLGDGVGVRRAHRSQNRLDPDPSSACDEVPAIATVAVSDEEPWLLTPGGSRCERSRRSQAHAAHQRCGRRPTVDSQWRCAGSAAATRRECGDAQVRDDSSSASRRAKQNDATAQPCPARPSRACLASRTNRVPVVTRIGGRGDGAAVDDGPGCRRRADAAALSSRGRDLGGRGPKRRVLRQADGGRAQTSLSWLADTLLSHDRAAPIRSCRPTGGLFVPQMRLIGGGAAFEGSPVGRCTESRGGLFCPGNITRRLSGVGGLIVEQLPHGRIPRPAGRVRFDGGPQR